MATSMNVQHWLDEGDDVPNKSMIAAIAQPGDVRSEHLPDRFVVVENADIEPLFVCTACGHRGADIRALFEDVPAPSRSARLGLSSLK